MSDLAILRELIKKEAIVSPTNTHDGKQTATLEETDDRGVLLYSVEIKGIPKDAIIIKADEFPAPKPIFNNTKGECRRADFAIVINSTAGNFILYIEMKEGEDSIKKIIDQLKGAKCFMGYCREIVRAFWQKRDFLGAGYESRFVIIRKIKMSMAKRPTRPTVSIPKGGLNDRPDNALRISGKESLHFRELIHGKK